MERTDESDATGAAGQAGEPDAAGEPGEPIRTRRAARVFMLKDGGGKGNGFLTRAANVANPATKTPADGIYEPSPVMFDALTAPVTSR